MGCDIHTIAQRRSADGKWENIEDLNPFDWQSYGMFGFLAGVRNYSALRPISEPRGLPDDFVDLDGGPFVGDHSFSWLSVEELTAFDYDAEMEDRRTRVQVAPNFWNGGATAEPGSGEMTTYREFLGEEFFRDLAALKAGGAERIVFGFDS